MHIKKGQFNDGQTEYNIILVRNIIYYYISVTQFYGNVEKPIIIADIILGTSFKNCMSLIIKYSKNR